jgi:hypothetical protein
MSAIACSRSCRVLHPCPRTPGTPISQRCTTASFRLQRVRRWNICRCLKKRDSGWCSVLMLQLLHNHRTRTTGEALLQQLGWQVMEGVSTHLQRIDRDKTTHHQIKTTPSYNARQKAIRMEKKARDAEDPELIALAEIRKGKAREKQQHYYSARKQLLYRNEEKKGEDEVVQSENGDGDSHCTAKDGGRKRGRPRKRRTEEKENDVPSAKLRSKKEEMDTTPDTARPVLHELVNHGAERERMSTGDYGSVIVTIHR